MSANPTNLEITADERQALAEAYVASRAYDLVKPGDALDRWAMSQDRGNLDALAALFAALIRKRPAPAGVAASLKLKNPEDAERARELLETLRSSHPRFRSVSK